LASLFEGAKLLRVESSVVRISTSFADFADYWTPFLGGTGPAPSYVASLLPAQRERLQAELQKRLVAGADGRIVLEGRGFAVRGVSAERAGAL
jgi:hypothetical protein